MTSREFFMETVKDEIPRFERLLKALPEDKLDWRPHEKSRSAKEIVITIASESGTFVEFMLTGKVDMINADSAKKGYTSLDQAVSGLAKHLNNSSEQASKMSEEEWEMDAEMLYGGKSVWKTKRGLMAWSLLLDLIHHRGQLSTYVRPMGGKVPAIYGPSGDSSDSA